MIYPKPGTIIWHSVMFLGPAACTCFFTTHRFLSHHYRDDDGHDDYDDDF